MFGKFKRNTDGNVAIMTSVLLSTLLIGIGAAVDYGGISSERQNLQDAVDSATLAAAKANVTDESKLKLIVRKFIQELDPSQNKIELDVKVVDEEVFVTATTVYDTYLMGIVGKKKMNIEVAAASPIAALTPIQVALVLDTTGSMEGSNIAALKSAANNMINEFENFKSTVAVSVVPFGQYVNVGLSQKRENWLDVSKDGTSTTEPVCWDERNVTKESECTKTGNTIYYDDVQDGRVVGQKSFEEETCTPAEYEYTGNRVCEDRTTTYTWNGCAGSRRSPYNEQAAFNNRRIEGVMNRTCGTELRPLTTNLRDVKSTISSLTTNGDTYIPSGVIWGWRTLQDDVPFKPNIDMGDNKNRTANTAKVMIIMTDGANTKSQGGSDEHLHDNSDKDNANKQTSTLCEAVKAEGIQIFTVAYRMGETDNATKTMLFNCASSKSNFAAAGNASELKKVFQDIANQLDYTRLSI